MVSDTLLLVDNLSWEVGQKLILSDIGFTVEKGSTVGLLGPNGAGKSSLMRCIYRMNEPTKGNILLNGNDLWEQSIKESARNIAVILQDHNAHMGLTVRDVVHLGLTPHKGIFEADTKAELEQIEKVIGETDLHPLVNEHFEHLSGGEKQRVMLARAIVQNPQLLIMDEPTNHLDVHYQIDMLQKVKALNKTILASFHDLNLAAAYCDKLIVLNKGRLVAFGKPAEILTESLLETVFKTKALVDVHPVHGGPRISYDYHA